METSKRVNIVSLLKIGIGLMFGLVLLPTNLKAIAILTFGLLVLANVVLRKKWVFDTKFFLTNATVYIVMGLTFFYSTNDEYALRKLTTMASLLVFPVIFALITAEERKRIFENLNTFLWIYLIGVFLLNVLPFIWFLSTQYTMAEMMEHFHTVMRVKLGKFNIHPIYLSMHCGIALIFSFYILRRLQSKETIAAVIAIDICLVLFLLLYAKKGPLISLMVVFSLFVVFQRKQRWIKPYLISIITLVALLVIIPRTRNKFIELQRIEVLGSGNVTSTNIRYTIYNLAKDLIVESPLYGYGVGDYNDKLDEKYQEKGDALLIKGSYNAHNQYLSFLLIGGAVLLIIFLLTVGTNLIFAVRFNNQILILLLVFYGLNMLTGNILEREAGVIFFAFFLNFFGSKSLFAHEE